LLRQVVRGPTNDGRVIVDRRQIVAIPGLILNRVSSSSSAGACFHLRGGEGREFLGERHHAGLGRPEKRLVVILLLMGTDLSITLIYTIARGRCPFGLRLFYPATYAILGKLLRLLRLMQSWLHLD